MSNPFSGIITSDMKTLFQNAIDSLLEDAALTVPCTVIYGDTEFTDCPNCYFSATGQTSSNVYTPGGPISFTHGICPYCKGKGKIAQNETETLYLCVLWDYRMWVGWRGTTEGTGYPEGFVQTMSKLTTLTKLKRAKELIVDSDIQAYVRHRFQRHGEPNMCGWGDDEYVFTLWKRTG